MGLLWTTHVETESGGRIEFNADSGDLELSVLDNAGVVMDKATISESDLRALIKDCFPAKKRGPRAIKKVT